MPRATRGRTSTARTRPRPATTNSRIGLSQGILPPDTGMVSGAATALSAVVSVASAAGAPTSWIVVVPLTSLPTASKALPVGLSAAAMKAKPSGETSPALLSSTEPAKLRSVT